MFLATGNHLEPFLKGSDPPECQEQGEGAVGQGQLFNFKKSPKHVFRSQIQVSTRPRTKFTVSLLDVVLGLLQPLHPVLDLQVGL